MYTRARAVRHRIKSAVLLAQQIDRVNFGLSVSVLLGLTLPLLVFPSETAAVLAAIYAWIANTFGWFYILTGASTLALVLYIAFSRYGAIRLGFRRAGVPYGELGGHAVRRRYRLGHVVLERD